MIELKKCDKVGCNPVEQTRGEMKPQDHHMQHNRYEAVAAFASDIENHGIFMSVPNFKRDAYEVEDLGLENAYDFRISCSKCGKATGWDRRDKEVFVNVGLAENRRQVVAGGRDGNMDTVRTRWNEMVT